MLGLTNEAPIRWRWLGRIAGVALAAGIVAAIVAGLVAFAVSQSLPKEYDAQAGIIVGSLTATSTDELDAYERLASTYAELATSSPLLSRVIDRLGLTDSPVDLATRIDVRASVQGIVLIDATSTNAIEAAQIANTIADEIVNLAQPAVVPSPSAGASAAAPTPSPTRTQPTASGSTPAPTAASPSPAASAAPATPSLAAIFQPAVPPAGPSSPRVVLNMLIAGLLGFVLGAGFAVYVAIRRGATEGSAG
jgi:capsular polysaccharide biosynthesis protein